MPELTPKQLKFCEQYALCRNATQAAIAAGYSKKTAMQQGSRLLSNVKVKTKIAELLTESSQKAGLELTQVKVELISILSADMGNYADWDTESVTLNAKKDLTPDQLKAIEQVSESRAADGTKLLKIKLHSKLRAADLLIRLHEISELEAEIAAIKEKLGMK